MADVEQTLSALAGDIGALLKERGDTIAIAESSSGGLISAALLSVPGASAYFLGGGVIYTRDARRNLLMLPEDQVTMRASTTEYAAIVAQKIQSQLGATWGLGESGATGPTGNRYGDAAGHVAIAITGPTPMTDVLETGSDDREANMWRFADASLALLKKALAG